jgi:hypothetical protein
MTPASSIEMTVRPLPSVRRPEEWRLRNDHAAVIEHVRRAGAQPGRELQHYGTLARLPIALKASVCKESVENLNRFENLNR